MHKKESKTEKSFDELEGEYAKWEKFATGLLIVMAGILALLLWMLFEHLSSSFVNHLESTIFVLLPSSAVWAFPALFVSTFFSSVSVRVLFRSLLGRERYVEYAEYSHQKLGVKSWKLWRYMAYVLVPVCLVFSILCMDTYVSATRKGFVVNDLLGFGERFYSFDKIKDIELVKSFKAPSGNVLRHPYYELIFKDGSRFDFHHSFVESTFEQQQKIAGYLSQFSGVLISVSDPFPDNKLAGIQK